MKNSLKLKITKKYLEVLVTQESDLISNGLCSQHLLVIDANLDITWCDDHGTLQTLVTASRELYTSTLFQTEANMDLW